MTAETKYQKKQEIVIHCNGSGMRGDGTGSGFAWTRVDTNEGRIAFINNLTNAVAEFRAIRAALRAMPVGATVCIRSSSEVACKQLVGEYRVTNSTLAGLYEDILAIEQERQLLVSATWILKPQNRAEKMLQRAKSVSR